MRILLSGYNLQGNDPGFLGCFDLYKRRENCKEWTFEAADCFCIKRTLFYSPSQRYGGIPYLMIWGEQQNVWLTKALDGSLIAKIWNYTTGVVSVVPFYKQGYVWARFKPVGD